MKDLGFARPPGVGLGGWVRSEEGGSLVVWTQLGKWNYRSDPEGYRFTLECQLGSEPFAGAGSQRVRYYDLLDKAQKQEHLAIYNRVMAKAKPNPEYMAILSPREQARHAKELRPRTELPERWDDPWLPYIDDGDVEDWMRFLATAMPTALSRFRAIE